MSSTKWSDKIGPILAHRRFPLFIALLAMALAFSSIQSGLQSDDYIHRAVLTDQLAESAQPESGSSGLFTWLDGDPARTRELMNSRLPWWTYEEIKISFWRPLAELSHRLDYQLWPESTIIMRFQNLVWFGLMVGVVALLFRRLTDSPVVAGLAALLFAISRTHADSLSMIACRCILMATVFGVLALIFHDQSVKDNRRSSVILGPVFFLVSLLSSEYGVVAFGYLLAYWLFLDERETRQKITGAVPYSLILLIWIVVYKALGYGAFGSGFYSDPVQAPIRFLSAIVERLPILFTGQWFTLPIGTFLLLPEAVYSILWALSLILFLMIVLLFILLVRKEAAARFWAAGLLISLILMSTSLPFERTLTFAGLGVFGLLALYLRGWFAKAEWYPKRLNLRTPFAVMSILFILIHLVLPLFTLSYFIKTAAETTDQIMKAPVVSIPNGTDLQDQSVILLNPPSVIMATYLEPVRLSEGKVLPASTRIIASGTDSVEIKRVDATTLEIEPKLGFISNKLDATFRGASFPMAVGQNVDLGDMTVTVLSVTDDQRPKRVSFKFSVPLEHQSLKLLEWREDGYSDFNIPAIGEVSTLELTL